MSGGGGGCERESIIFSSLSPLVSCPYDGRIYDVAYGGESCFFFLFFAYINIDKTKKLLLYGRGAQS